MTCHGLVYRALWAVLPSCSASDQQVPWACMNGMGGGLVMVPDGTGCLCSVIDKLISHQTIPSKMTVAKLCHILQLT